MIQFVNSGVGECPGGCDEGYDVVGGLGDTAPTGVAPNFSAPNIFGAFTSFIPSLFSSFSGQTGVQSTSAFEALQAQEDQARANSTLLITALAIGGLVSVAAIVFHVTKKSRAA